MFIPLHDKNDLRHVRRQYVTLGLIAANCLVYLLSTSGWDGMTLQHYAVLFGLTPQYLTHIPLADLAEQAPVILATPLTYAFLHGDWLHLLGNMAFLWVFGDNVEDAMGHKRFLLFYCLCAIGAGATHIGFNWDSSVPLVGASGATAGIIAAYLLLHPDVRVWILVLWRIPLSIPALYCLGAWLLLQVFNSLTSADDMIAWWAHVGGAATGAVLIVLLKSPDVRLFQRSG